MLAVQQVELDMMCTKAFRKRCSTIPHSPTFSSDYIVELLVIVTRDLKVAQRSHAFSSLVNFDFVVHPP